MAVVFSVCWECPEEEARSRVERDGNGEVTDDGNYRREIKSSYTVYRNLLSFAEEDSAATVEKAAF